MNLRPPQSRVLTLVFTDLAGSLALKMDRGDHAAGELIARHHALVQELVSKHQGREIDSAGDGFFLTFETPSAAVTFALELQQTQALEADLPGVRIGIHIGEVTERLSRQGAPKPVLVEGLAVDLASRVQALAVPGQILLTAAVLGSARQRIREDAYSGKLKWIYHGPYRFKGFKEPVEVGEVGLEGISPLKVPENSEKGRRVDTEAPAPGKPRGAQIDALIARHYELQTQIEQMRREVTILYSDIVGYTRYTNEFGDLAGRTLRERHDRLFQLYLEKHGGTWIKSIGDAVMIRFDDPNGAIETAFEALRSFSQENQDFPDPQQIHLRIGVATGKAIIEPEDVSGEVVNLSARLCKLAEVDGILTSERTVGKLEPYFVGRCVPCPEATIRGIERRKAKVFRVVWDCGTPAVPSPPEEAWILEISLEGDQLKESLQMEGAVKDTVSHYEFLPWKKEAVEKASLQIIRSLKTSAASRDPGSLAGIHSAGKLLHDLLITAKIQDTLRKSENTFLVIKIQDSLLSVPWELLHDGERFWLERFAMGRRVASRIEARPNSRPEVLRPRITILSDPQNDLDSAQTEGEELAATLRNRGRLAVNLEHEATLATAREAIRTSDILHFCGHADYHRRNPQSSGWHLADGKLTRADILQLADSEDVFPRLIFANACQSGRSEDLDTQEQVYGLASAFLHAGVRHYIGTLGDVLDAPSRDFAGRFYESLARGNPIGVAVRDARTGLMHNGGKSSLIWASYVVYGDPSAGVFGVVDDSDLLGHSGEPPMLSSPSESPERQEEEAAPQASQPAGAPAARRGRTGLRKYATVLSVATLILAAAAVVLLLRGPQGSTGPGQPPDPADTQGLLQYLSQRKKMQGEQDAWTSRPLTLALMPFESRGAFDEDASEPGNTYEFLYEQLARTDEIQLTEREAIHEVLAELNVGSSELADPNVRAQLGRLLFSRLLATGTLTGKGKEKMLALRVFDCETTAVVAFGRVSGATDSETLSQAVVEQILPSLRESYPLQGKVVQVSDDKVFINIGKDVGVKEEQAFFVYREMDSPDLGGLRERIGTLKIAQAGDGVSLAHLVEQTQEIEVDFKVAEAPVAQ